MTAIPSQELLKELRMIDEQPQIHDWVRQEQSAVAEWLKGSPGADRTFSAFVTALKDHASIDPDSMPPHIEEEKVEHACSLFSRYGTEIGAALLVAALPEAYAAGFGAWVLYGVSRLADQSGDLTRRVARTAQFLVNIMSTPQIQVPVGSGDRKPSPARQIAEALWKGSDASAAKRALALRLQHDYIRVTALERRAALGHPYDDPDPDARLLNQEDLLGTLLSFSVTVFEVLEKLGVAWTKDDEESYLHMWDLVGHYLGIGDHVVVQRLDSEVKLGLRDRAYVDAAKVRGTIRPHTVHDARDLMARIRQRVWADPRTVGFVPSVAQYKSDLQPGRMLIRALLDDINRAMPIQRRQWPIRVMRQLVPPLVSDRLALGATSGSDFVASGLIGVKPAGGLFAHSHGARQLSQANLRRMANDVASRYFVQLIQEGLVIPRLPIGLRPDGAPPGGRGARSFGISPAHQRIP